MDPSDYPMSRSPRKELQGPRPAPLKVRKDSYKIKKPPLAPQPTQQQHQQQQHQQQHQQQQHQQTQIRAPVIIYTVSPKVIHINPSDFMNLVQRLTGSTSSSTTSDHTTSGAISPAARLATLEKTKPPTEGKKQQNYGFVEGIEMNPGIERTSNFFPGILSPGPTSLPRISPNFFSSPPSDPNSLGFSHDVSPVLHGNRNFIEGSNFMPSPSSFSISPYFLPSPNTIELFNNLFDL